MAEAAVNQPEGGERAAVEADPATAFDQAERRARITLLLNLLRVEIDTSVKSQADRDDMEYILMALAEGSETPTEIEQATAIPRDRIYRLLERMRGLAARALKRLPDERRN